MSSFFPQKEPPNKTAEPSGETSSKAREICRQGVFENAYLEMKELGLMKFEVTKLEKEYAENLSALYHLSRKDLEMLTIIMLFDKKTLLHSFGTCMMAKKKMDNILEKGFSFMDLVKKEGATEEQFYRACVFHDIGKMAIPRFLLNSSYTDENWAQAFSQMHRWRKYWIAIKYKLDIPKNLLSDTESLMNYMMEKRIRGVKFVPVKMLFSKKQIRDLENKGFYENMSLLDIMRKHEKESEKILTFMGYHTEAKIVGSHHNYENETNHKNGKDNYLIRKENLAADILHLADMQEALKSNRAYLMQKPILRTMAFMVDDAKKGLVDCRIAHLWIKEELDRIDNDYLSSVENHTKKDGDYAYMKIRKNELESIKSFLSETEEIMEKSPLAPF